MNFFPDFPNIPNQNLFNGNMLNNSFDYINNIFNKINEFDNRIKRIEQRVKRLENESDNNSYNYNEPDNSLYMI